MRTSDKLEKCVRSVVLLWSIFALKPQRKWRCRIASTVGRRWFADTKTIRRAIERLFPIGYKRWERFRRKVEGYHMSWTINKWKSVKTHVIFCSLGTKGSVFASYSYRGWKVHLFWELQAQQIMNWPRRTIHTDRKTESLWQKDDALSLMKPEGRGLLWCAKLWETVNTKRYQQQLTDLNRFLLEKKTGIPKEATQSHFSLQMKKPVRET